MLVNRGKMLHRLVPGGILPKTWCTGMLKGFEVHFHQFWYNNGVDLKLFQVY